MKAVITLLVSMLVLVTACSKKTVPGGNDNSQATQWIEARDYVFRATTALPRGGRSIQLTSDYTFRVKRDTIQSFLPYFGRAYTAPIGARSGGIEFTSTKFSYKADRKRNGGYEIEIIPQDANDVQRIFLALSKGGYGSLTVTSQNRQGITFNGNLVTPQNR